MPSRFLEKENLITRLFGENISESNNWISSKKENKEWNRNAPQDPAHFNPWTKCSRYGIAISMTPWHHGQNNDIIFILIKIYWDEIEEINHSFRAVHSQLPHTLDLTWFEPLEGEQDCEISDAWENFFVLSQRFLSLRWMLYFFFFQGWEETNWF